MTIEKDVLNIYYIHIVTITNTSKFLKSKTVSLNNNSTFSLCVRIAFAASRLSNLLGTKCVWSKNENYSFRSRKNFFSRQRSAIGAKLKRRQIFHSVYSFLIFSMILTSPLYNNNIVYLCVLCFYATYTRPVVKPLSFGNLLVSTRHFPVISREVCPYVTQEHIKNGEKGARIWKYSTKM